MTHDAAREAVAAIIAPAIDKQEFPSLWNKILAGRIIARLIEMGFVMLPAEATDGMIIAAIDRRMTDEDYERGGMYRSIWRAMVAELTSQTGGRT